MADRLTAGREFLKGVLQHLSDEARAAVEAQLADPNTAAPLLAFAGDGALRQSEFSSSMDAIRRREQQLQDYAKQLDDYRKEVEAARLAGKPEPEPNPNPAPAPTGDDAPLTLKALGDVLNRREGYYAKFTADMSRIVAEHQKHFGEVLDPNTLLEHPRVGEIGLDGAWRELHKPKFDKLATDTQAAERERIRKEVRAEILQEQAQTVPYPLGGGSPLDGLGKEGDYSPEAAARAYNELIQPGSR